MSKEIPGPQGWPLIGNVGQIDMGKFHVTLNDFKKTYGNVFQFYIFTQRIIVISDVDLLKQAFNKQELCYRPDSFMKELKHNGSGYLDSNFSDKEVMLKSVLWKAISTIQDDAVLLKHGEKELNSFLTSLETTDDIAIVSSMTKTIAKQYCSIIMGMEATDKHGDAVVEFLESVYDMYSGGKVSLLTKIPWLKRIPGAFKASTDRLVEARNDLGITIVADTRKVHRIGKEHGVLQHLLTASTKEGTDMVITEENLVACTMDLVFNMVIPTAHNVAFILLQAIKYPEMQQKIHDELEKIGKKRDVTEIKPAHVPYVEAFILECMRYLSLVNISVPHFVNEDTEVDGYLFPKNATVFGDFYGIHHDEALWDEPWKLKPERFLDESGKRRPETDPLRKNLFHFSIGLRMCRGPNVAIEKILHNVLSIFMKYKVLPATDSELPPTDPSDYEFNLAIKIPEFKVTFEKK